MAKPCRNSRFIGPPVEHRVVTPDGVEHTIVERAWELLPDWGCNSLTSPTTNGFNPDMQTDQIEMEFTVPRPEIRRWLTDPKQSPLPSFPLRRQQDGEGVPEPGCLRRMGPRRPLLLRPVLRPAGTVQCGQDDPGTAVWRDGHAAVH